MAATAWIDLRDHNDGGKLKFATIADADGRQRRYLFIVGLSNTSWRWTRAQELLGFVASPRGKYLSRAVRDGEMLKPSSFHAIWPNAIRVQMAVEDMRLNLTAGKKTALAKKSDAQEQTEQDRGVAIEAGVVVRLGRNAQGDEVFSNAAGSRFFKRLDGAVVYEADYLAPEIFLRSRDQASLDRCVDGFAQCLMHGEAQHLQDLNQFILTTTGKPGPYGRDDYDQFAVMIDAALVRNLCQVHGAAQDAYGDANRAFDMLPPYAGGRRGLAAMPLPVSVMAQRLLGDTRGKRIVLPNAWDGAAFAFMSDGTDIVAYTDGKNLSRYVRDVRTENVTWLGEFSPREESRTDGIFLNCDPAVDANGVRLDYRHALICAKTLAPQARAVFVLAGDTTPGQVTGECAAFMSALAQRYQIEGVVEVAGSLCAKSAAERGLRIFSIKNSAPLPLQGRPEVIPVVYSWDEFKSHVDELISTIELKEAESDGIDLERSAQDNDFQRPYIAFSKVGEAVTMVPKNLQGPLQEALANVERIHGPVDAYVEEALALGPNTLSQRFSPEQVDAIAIGLSRLEQKKGVIIGDETGIGKGRTLSALAAASALKSRKVIFITDRANLFSDLVRDLRDIGEWGRFRPSIMNANARLTDVITNEVIAEGTSAAEMKRIIRERLTLDDVDSNIVFTTFSQLAKDESEKAGWLLDQAQGALLIVDEAHIAAGSNSNISSFIVELSARADAVVYSSATWAKSSENLHIYSRAFPDSINVGTLSATMRQGGEAFSEVFSSMLAKDGAFIRREHDLSRIEFSVEVDSTRLQRNSDISDKVSEIISSMVYLSGELDRMLIKINTSNLAALREARAAREASNAAEGAFLNGKIFTNSFGAGSVLYQVMRRTLAVLNSDNAVDLALRAVANNRKPVIVFEDTGEAFLKRLIQEEMIPGVEGEEDTAPTAVRVPNIRDFMRNIMRRLGVVRSSEIKDKDLDAVAPEEIEQSGVLEAGEAVDSDGAIDFEEIAQAQDVAALSGETFGVLELPGLSDEMQAKYRTGVEKIMEMVDKLPPIPLNAVDLIRAKLEAQGLRCGELSGRTVRQAPEPGQYIPALEDAEWSGVVWKLHRRVGKKTDVTQTVWNFNNGEIDVILINRSAAAGISLHASPRFVDSRRRELIELQIPENTTDRIQLYGRVNRYDQVVPPVISIATTGIWGEVRQLMMQNKKLARLSANIRSSRENAAEIRMVPDLLNVVGEEVARRYLEENGGIRARMGIPIAEVELSEKNGGTSLIGKMTARAALLRVAEQKQVYGDLYEMFDDAVAGYELEGENPLKARELNIRAETVRRKRVIGIDMQGLGSSFDGAVYLRQIKWTEDYRPIKTKQLVDMVHQGRRALVEAGMAEDAVNPLEQEDRRRGLVLASLAQGSDPLQRTEQGRQGYILKELNSASSRNLTGTLSALKAIATANGGDMKEDDGAESLPQISMKQLAEKMAQIYRAKAAMELIGSGFDNVEDALSSETPNAVKRAHAKAAWCLSNFERLVPGCNLVIRKDEGRTDTIITGLVTPEKGREADMAKWKIQYVAPGDEKVQSIALQSLMGGAGARGGGSHRHYTLYGDEFVGDSIDRVRRRFGVNWTPTRTRTAEILDGNMYLASDWAASAKLGQGVMYSDQKGARHRGILVKDGLELGEHVPVRVWTAKMLQNFVLRAFEINRSFAERGVGLSHESFTFATNFAGAMRDDGQTSKGTFLSLDKDDQLTLLVEKSDLSRILRSLRAIALARARATHESFDLMTKEEKAQVMQTLPKISSEARKNKKPKVIIGCQDSQGVLVALEMLTKASGLEVYVSAASNYANAARAAQEDYFSKIRSRWAQVHGIDVPDAQEDQNEVLDASYREMPPRMRA